MLIPLIPTLIPLILTQTPRILTPIPRIPTLIPPIPIIPLIPFPDFPFRLFTDSRIEKCILWRHLNFFLFYEKYIVLY